MNAERIATREEVFGYKKDKGVAFRTIHVLDKKKKTKKTQITLAFLPKANILGKRGYDVAFTIRSKKDPHDRLEGQKQSARRLFDGNSSYIEVDKGTRILDAVKGIIVGKIQEKHMGDFRYIKEEHLV